MIILEKNKDFCVVVKPHNTLSEHGNMGMPELIAQELCLSADQVFPVHRLDLLTGGLMVYALSQSAAARLSSDISQGKMQKYYLGITGTLPEGMEPEGIWEDYLYYDRNVQKAFIVTKSRKGVKQAVLDYKVMDQTEGCTLILFHLHTGRTHQIRVQCASRRVPLIGDRRYGSAAKSDLALWSCGLSFPHPVTHKQLTYTYYPDTSGKPWNLFPDLMHIELPDQ